MAEPTLSDTNFFYNETDGTRTPKLKRLLAALIAAEIVTTNEVVAALADLVLAGQAGKVVTVNAGGDGFDLVTPTYLTDGDKGDIVVSATGAAWTLDPTVVTAFARTFLNDPDAATVLATIGAAAAIHTHVAAEVTDFSEAVDDRVNALLAGTQITRTYDDGAGTLTLAIADDAVTNAKLANMAEGTIKGRAAGAGTGDPTDLTPAQARTALELGNAALATVGTSGDAVPKLNAANTFSAAQIISVAGSATTAHLGLAGSSSHAWIDFGATGFAAPTFTNRSAGIKLCLFKALSGAAVDYGIGIESGAMWFSASTSAQAVKFYGGTTLFGSVSSAGFFVGSTQVVGTRKTGWGTMTGTATRTAFDTASVTLPQLAERVKALNDDLRSHGLIGT